MDPDLVVSEMVTMEALVAQALGGTRFGAQLLSAFALAVLLLAAIGTYGVVAFLVGRRTPEIGVRMALGARGRDVLSLIIGQGMAPVLVGLATGLLGALALGRGLAGLLFGVPPHDPATLACASAVLAAGALLACSLPARRAAHIDPPAPCARIRP